jgi:hypothetical protein
MKDIDRRIEPMVQATLPQDPASLYLQDPTTDPDIAQRQAQSGNEYPPFVFVDYHLSSKSYWGKPNADGKDHLVPKREAIAQVYQIHLDGEKTIGKMIELARQPANAANFLLIEQSFTKMLASTDVEYQFPIMNSLASMTSRAFAERAFQKYMYLAAAAKLKDGEEPPEWFGGMTDRMTKASAACGTWSWVHLCAWRQLEWSGSPTYNNVMNDIIMRMVNNARYLEKQFGPTKRELPKVSDHYAVAAML